MRTSSLFSVLTLLAFVAFVAAADTPKPKRPLCGTSLPVDGTTGVVYATGTPTATDAVAVAVQGSIVAVGYQGTVYIYWWTPGAVNSLSLKQNLTITDDTISQASYGASLSLNNNILVVGQPQWIDLASPGANVHGRVFTYQTLSDSTTFIDFFQLGDPITCTDTQDGLQGNSGYGTFVFQRNMTLSISSPQCCAGNRIGAAYTYHFNETTTTWEPARVGSFGELPLQTPASLPVGSQFGASIAFDKTLLLGSLPYLNDPNDSSRQDTGGILYFNFNIDTAQVPPCGSPTCQAKLATWGQYPPDADARCGTVMSELNSDISNRISIGCPGQANATGSVLIGSAFPPSFSISNRILPPVATLGEGFGASLAAQYDTVAVGTEAGSKVYVYERVPIPRSADSYVNTQTLTESRSGYGSAIALDLDLLVVGSWGAVDIYNCGNPVSAAVGLIPMLGLLFFSALLLL